MHPVPLPANQPRCVYRGAGRIAALRGTPRPPDPFRPAGTAPPDPVDPFLPEDWIGSTTVRAGHAPAGLTVLPDGRLLRDAVRADPLGWLGADHLRRHGPDTGILVKLLDAGERLPLHAHPDGDFARSHVGSPHGGTEAWVIVQAAPDAAVHLGFSRDVGAAELAAWVAGQEVEAMLAATNRVPVRAGDALLCPAGVPHAVGEGILLVGLQEPADLPVLLEWKGFDVDGGTEGHLGLGFDAALACVDRSAWSPARIDAELRGAPSGRPARDGVRSVLPPAADPFVVAERVEARPRARLDAAFGVLVVLDGSGLLAWSDGDEPVEVVAGDTIVVPYAAGTCRVEGPLTAVRCRTAPV